MTWDHPLAPDCNGVITGYTVIRQSGNLIDTEELFSNNGTLHLLTGLVPFTDYMQHHCGREHQCWTKGVQHVFRNDWGHSTTVRGGEGVIVLVPLCCMFTIGHIFIQKLLMVMMYNIPCIVSLYTLYITYSLAMYLSHCTVYLRRGKQHA